MSERNKKPNARRLFSLDSLKSGRTASSDNDQYLQERMVDLSQVDEIPHDDPFGDGASRIDAISSIQQNDPDDKDKRLGHSKLPTTGSTAQTSEQPSRTSTPDSSASTTSASRKRWDKIRQHVLLSSSSVTRQPSPQLGAPAVTLSQPPRSITPKPFRLARLGFRPVVEQTREAVEENLAFANEIAKACWLSRYGEQPKAKSERDTIATTMGSTLYLPFVTNPSLSGPSMIPSVVSKRQDMVMTQSSLAPSISGQYSIPTLKPLWQLLMTYATLAADGTPNLKTLPHETLILSVLQGPFLRPGQQGWLQEERRFAMESFELIFRTWFPDNESSLLNYCQWCCIAALMPPGHLRLRALNGIYGLLGSRNTDLIWSPGAFRSLFANLLRLLALSSTNLLYVSDTDGMKLIQDCLSLLRAGSYVTFDLNAVVECYGLPFSPSDEAVIRDLIAAESLAQCIETLTGPTRTWFIQYACNKGWILSRQELFSDQWSTLLHVEKLGSFSRALARVLSPNEAGCDLSDSDVQSILQLLTTKILPKVETIELTKATKIKQYIAKIALRILILDGFDVQNQWAASAISEWNHGATDWKKAFESALQDLISKEVWSTILKAMNVLLKSIQDPIRQHIVAFVLPLLNQRIAEDPPPHPSPNLSSILSQLSQRYPPLFYKCLFSCAAASKDYTIIIHLCTLTAINKFVPDFWLRDAEMLSIALINDIGKTADDLLGKVKPARLGQLVVLVELIGQIQAARHRKEELLQTDSAFLEVYKVAIQLESRLGVLLDAREKEAQYPLSHRALYCILFRELRLLTRSTKSAPWLTLVVTWLIDYHNEHWGSEEDSEELDDTFSRLQTLYEAARYGAQLSGNLRRTSVFSLSNFQPDTIKEGQTYGVFTTLAERLKVINSAQKGFAAKAMKLLVLMSTLITTEDYVRLGPIIWTHSFQETIPSSLNSACYLAMQCAEKTSQDFLAIIEVDLKSSDDLTRLYALQRLSIICARRFELVLLPAITDRHHRAFKLARGPLSFIPADMGSSSYVPEDNIDNSQHSLPLELMKQLAEIGWAQDDATADSRLAWLQMPMQLLPSSDLSRLETTSDSYKYPSSPSFTSQGSPASVNEGTITTEQLILRRNSSSGGPSYSVKRRSIFVSALGDIFLRIAVLVFDPNIVVASAAKILILDLMRNDPGLLSRPLFDLLSDDDKDISLAMSRMDLLIHAHRIVPPAAAHYMFNHLSGYLKTVARESKRPGLVEDFARTILPLVDLAPDVSGMSIRELRRSKLEYCFLPTGSFWFPKPSLNEHMFPTELSTSLNASESVPPFIVSITLIRVCQNLMFASMLRKNQQDVRFIRKQMSRFDLPTLGGDQRPSDLELRDFLLTEGHARKETINETLVALSVMLSRSYLLLVTQIFLSMPRHLSDRNELAVLVDGLNRILLVHGDDIGIVGQVLITLMVASTRFRRLFTSGGAYTLFMPAVLKVYADAGSHSGIRLAIEYTVGRFYAFHDEAFVFQSLDVFSRLATIPEIAGEKLGEQVSNLFASLRRGLSSSSPDVAGIHDANKGQEREAFLLNSVEEKPQALLASMKRGASEDKNSPILNLPEEYQGTQFRIGDLVKLFLTIIAHDVSSLRAQNFLKLLGLVVPYIYVTSIGSRSILQEGIDALSRILIKPSTKGKTTHPESESLLPPEKQWNEATRSDSDITRMRLDFLSLVISFTRAGGSVAPPTVPRIMDTIKALLKDSDSFYGQVSAFLSDFTEALLLRDNPPVAKDITFYIRDLISIISTYGTKLHFGRTFAVLAKLNNMPIYANDMLFFRIMKQICEAGLTTCSMAGKDNSIISLPHRSNLVILLSQAVGLHGIDIASELEKCPPTYDFLAGIVLPLVMSLSTDMTMSPTVPVVGSGNQTLHLWIRLLQYTLSACQTNRRFLESDNSRKSMDKRMSTASILSSQVSSFVIALQVLKTIFIRAGDELSFRLPGLWHRLASVFKTLLADGNAEFALRAPELSLPSSPLPSPLSSPRTSFQLDPLAFPETARTEPHTATHFQRGYLSPRTVDYALWSLFELLCSYRTPLLLQMRHFIMEKVLELNHALQSQRFLHSPHSFSSSTSSGRSMPASAFSKLFRRTSGLSSPAVSPKLSPAQDSSHYSGYLTVSEGRKPGYQYQSPVASYPSGTQDLKTGPQILHLGPVSASLLRPAAVSGDSTNGISYAAKTTKIKNLSLIRATYRRIRFIQTYMGYHNVLHSPDHEALDADTDEVVLSSWTKYQALEAIKAEVALLLEEFGHHQNLHEAMITESERSEH